MLCFLFPIANRLDDERTITPSESAGVAISNSPIALVAMWRNSRPAPTTRISAILVREVNAAVGRDG